MEMKKIENETCDVERGYYASRDTEFYNIRIEGPQDGESAFKECRNINVQNSYLDLRYPFWHDNGLVVESATMTEGCRAAFWYDNNVIISKVKSKGIKAFRECQNIEIDECDFESEEFGWRNNKISVKNSKINGVYGFFWSKNVYLKNVQFSGKYSFQYIKNLIIADSNLDTKDAFWHSENVVVKNSVVKGEYLAWYSKNITFINCKIIGTQPLCYVKNLKLIDCEFVDCDLAFEYSDVKGNITGPIKSIKNPLKGKILTEIMPEMIVNEDDRSHGRFKIAIAEK